jgi:predicted O-methyltransferase YrrM
MRLRLWTPAERETVVSKFLSFAPPGHYYSPLPDYEAVQQEYDVLVPRSAPELPGIAINAEAQRALLRQFAPFHAELPFSETQGPGSTRYYYDNMFFPRGDAIVLCAMLRLHHPTRVLEIGSGFSSAAILDVIDTFEPQIALTCVEPDTSRLRSLLRPGDERRFHLIEGTLQSLPDAPFDALGAGDVLFIDSSHVAKIGSDVSRLLFHVLPRLAPGVLVHVHDIFWPFEYPRAWYAEGRAWNEAPFLRSFLMFNQAFEILYFNDYMASFHADDVARSLPECLKQPGGSLWLRKRA